MKKKKTNIIITCFIIGSFDTNIKFDIKIEHNKIIIYLNLTFVFNNIHFIILYKKRYNTHNE